MSARFRFQGRVLIACALFALTTSLGCTEHEQIQSYTVAKEEPPNPPAPVSEATPAEATDRMLAAILPAGDRAWFFKAVGPIAVMNPMSESITDFYSGVRLDDTGRPRWELPTGWKEDPPSGLRAATLWVPTDARPIEISVTTLGWGGTAKDVLDNVNRWRRQMQLSPVDQGGLAESTRDLPAGDAKITLVDLQGKFETSGMMGPFAGASAGSRAAPSAQKESAELPAGHPPIDANRAPAAAAVADAQVAASLPTFEVPQSWQERPPSNSMRKAEFSTSDGAQEALVTISDFPASAPDIADPLPNVNRWRREIGLREITSDELAGSIEKIEIAGQPATYARMIPDAESPEESQAGEATLAAMVGSGDAIWFIKMKGARSLVAAQEDQFKAFLKSIRFPAAGGANHGN